MRPELLQIGPVSFPGFLIFSLCVFACGFLLKRLLGKKRPALAREILQYAAILSAAVFVLMLTKKSFPLRTYGLLVALGFVAASLTAAQLAKRRSLAPGLFLDLGVVTLIAGIIGTRVFYIIFHNWDHYIRHPIEMLYIWQGGQVLYGGIIFGGIAAVLWLRKKSLPVLSVLDLVMIGVLIGIGFGRMGCFSAGCCYGMPWEGVCALHFPPEAIAFQDHLDLGLIGPDALRSLGCWPSQIMASLFAFAAAGLLILLEPLFRRRSGLLFSAGLMTYAAGRFVEEALRTNPKIGPFSAAQWTSFAIFACGLGLGLVLLIKGRMEKKKPD